MADVSPEPHSDGELVAGQLRASHHDRARTVRRLQQAGLAGRLDADEVDERTTAAMAARTLGDLATLVDDLPGQSPLSAPPAEAGHRDRIGSELYSAKRDGRWTVPPELDVQVDGGSVVLDFTEAEITTPTLDIDATIRGGSLTLITRPGIDVHTHDLMVDNGTVKVDAPWTGKAEGPWTGEVVPPVLTITVTGTVAVGDLTARPPRRNLKEWLRGDPRPYSTGP
jgi:hypothetical protein